jgi:glycosyltransferase involved in cell wall biosynthesis
MAKRNMQKKITVLIPCFNEEKGIGKVIDGIPRALLKKRGYRTEIIVINNNSIDKTEQVAKKKKVKVIFEAKKGKGNALKTGFSYLSEDTTYVVMLDGDNTYKGNEIPRLLEPLENNFCDVIVGSRLSGKIRYGSLKAQHRLANWFYTFLVRHIYRVNITDVLSGYFAWKKEVIDVLSPHINSRGFAIEMEMITKMVLLKKTIYSVPITYDKREGESKLQTIRDGVKVLGPLFLNFYWRPHKIVKRKTRHILTFFPPFLYQNLKKLL